MASSGAGRGFITWPHPGRNLNLLGAITQEMHELARLSGETVHVCARGPREGRHCWPSNIRTDTRARTLPGKLLAPPTILMGIIIGGSLGIFYATPLPSCESVLRSPEEKEITATSGSSLVQRAQCRTPRGMRMTLPGPNVCMSAPSRCWQCPETT